VNGALTKLLSIGSDAIVGRRQNPIDAYDLLLAWGPIGRELAELLATRDGFFAYESSLLVRPLSHTLPPLGVANWNQLDLWKRFYTDDLSGMFCFAEDVFGNQFSIYRDGVFTFDPEIGKHEPMAATLGDWAQSILSDYEYRTGYPLSHAWQLKHGPLPAGMRLLPKTPFVLGGKYELENLYLLEDTQGMLFRASIANQIRDVPEGGEVIIEIINKPNRRNE
jgi:hypothetical protein